MARRRITLDLDEALIRAAERERVDTAFAAMADDVDYQRELLSIDQEMSSASDRAWVRIDMAERGGARGVSRIH